MGISKDAVKLLIHEAKRKPFSGSALMLGKQNVRINEQELESIANQLQFYLFEKPKIDPLSTDSGLRAKGCISDSYLFSRLGFSDCKAIDYSDFEGAEYIHDFNKLLSKKSLLFESFNFIFDSGTLEHIFHLPNALKNIYYLLKNEGRIYHLVPSSNHMNHGFHMFSPLFFEEYYSANQFELNDMKLIQCGSDSNSKWKIAKYESGLLERVTNEDFGSGCYMIHSIATKKINSSENIIPQQKRYSAGVWIRKSSSKTTNEILERFKNYIKENEILYGFTLPIVNRFRRKMYAYQFKSTFKSVDKYFA